MLRSSVAPSARKATASLRNAIHQRQQVATFSTTMPRVPERRPDEAGPGGRASDAGQKVAIFGATGFLGRYVCSDIGANGGLAYIANRGDEFEPRHLRPMFDLGRTRFVFYSPRDRESVKEVIADADVVINLIGKYYESKSPCVVENFPYVGYKTNFSFEDTNVAIPRMLAECCHEMQIDNFIHVSTAAASPDSTSEWARTKYEGELAIKEIYPWVTIVRPTQLFGYEDRFLNTFANFARLYPATPLIDGGHALTQPVLAQDVAQVIARILDAPADFEGKQVDCFGPSDYTYAELAAFVDDITGQRARLVEMPKAIVKSMAEALQYQRNPLLTPDLVELWSNDYLPSMAPEDYAKQTGKDKILTMEHFGVKATPIEKIAFNYLHRFREGGHFILTEGYH